MKGKRRLQIMAVLVCICMLCCEPLSAAAASLTGGDAGDADGAADGWEGLEQGLAELESDDADYDGYIIKLKEDADTVMLSSEDEGISEIENAEGYYVAEDLASAEDFAAPEDIEFIEPNYIVTLFDSDMSDVKTDVSASDNDAHLALMNVDTVRDEYGIAGEDLDTVTDMGNDGRPADKIVISVIDSGLDTDHEDIDYSYVIEGKSFVTTDTTADNMGHGTFVTGEIIACNGNGIGIDGIADGVYVMPLKVFSSRSTTNAIIINAINYAVEQKKLFTESKGAEGVNTSVINMSLGSESASTALKNAVDTAIEAGIIVLCAAGNDEDSRASYPAQYAIGVGSTDSKGTRSYYSQILSEKNETGWQNKVWVTAPGESYTSLWYTGGYYQGSGTSFSSPQAAALAAIAVSLKNNLTEYYSGKTDDDGNAVTTNHQAFRQLLKDTSRRLDNGLAKASNGQDTYYGWGMIDFKAVTDTLISFEANKGSAGSVSFSVDNGAGTQLTAEKNSLNIELREYTGSASAETGGTALSDPLTADENGVYSLKIGSKYRYTVSADKYTSVSKDLTIVMPSRVIYITMEGLDYKTSFSVTDTSGNNIADPDITVKKVGGRTVTQSADGSFLTKNGSYTYTISAAGYFPIEGEFTVNDEENTYPDQKNNISAVLRSAADICSVTFDVTGSDGDPYGEVTLKDSSGAKVSPYADGAWKLEPDSYSYEVESDYYRPVGGEFTVAAEDKGTERVISVEMTRRLYWAFIDIMPLPVLETEGTTVEVKDSAGNMLEPFNGALGEYRIENGDYTYTVKAAGYKTEAGSFTVNGKIIYVDVLLEEGTDDTGSGGGSSGGSSGGSGSGGGGSSSGGSGGGSSSGGGGSGSSADTGSQTGGTTGGTDQSVSGRYADLEVQYHDFDDVNSSDWYYEAVNYAVTAGVFNGTGDRLFSPRKNMTRGMFVTVLYRLSGETAKAEASPFTDVAADAYYADAVAWAYKNSIVSGVSATSFVPDNYVTRQQIAVMLCGYAKKLGKDTGVHGDGAQQALRDYGSIAAYAQDAVSWAFENDIINGDSNGNFRPSDSATRAETSAIMMNFMKELL